MIKGELIGFLAALLFAAGLMVLYCCVLIPMVRSQGARIRRLEDKVGIADTDK